MNNPCDRVGGTCYEQMPEGQILLWIILIVVVIHLLGIAIGLWLWRNQDD
jgi:hypothetical protein